MRFKFITTVLSIILLSSTQLCYAGIVFSSPKKGDDNVGGSKTIRASISQQKEPEKQQRKNSQTLISSTTSQGNGGMPGELNSGPISSVVTINTTNFSPTENLALQNFLTQLKTAQGGNTPSEEQEKANISLVPPDLIQGDQIGSTPLTPNKEEDIERRLQGLELRLKETEQKEEERKLKENLRLKEEELKKKEEELRRKEEEMIQQEKIKQAEEEKQKQQEEARKLEERKHQEKLNLQDQPMNAAIETKPTETSKEEIETNVDAKSSSKALVKEFTIPEGLAIISKPNLKLVKVDFTFNLMIYKDKSSATHSDIKVMKEIKPCKDEEALQTKLQSLIEFTGYHATKSGRLTEANLLNEGLKTYMRNVDPSFVKFGFNKNEKKAQLLIEIPGGAVLFMKVPGSQ